MSSSRLCRNYSLIFVRKSSMAQIFNSEILLFSDKFMFFNLSMNLDSSLLALNTFPVQHLILSSLRCFGNKLGSHIAVKPPRC